MSPPGASGVLGTAVYNAFQRAGAQTVGLSHSQVKEGLVRLDLTNDLLSQGGVTLRKLFREHKFSCMSMPSVDARFGSMLMGQIGSRGNSLRSRKTAGCVQRSKSLRYPSNELPEQRYDIKKCSVG